MKDLHLEVGEDRLVLDSKGLFELVDFFLPCSVDQDIIDAQLNRNDDVSCFICLFHTFNVCNNY